MSERHTIDRAVQNYIHPPVLTMLFLGFSAGLPLALTAGTLTAWLATAGIEKSTIGLFALVGTPYTLKFLWSPIMDQIRPLPFFRKLGRRRGWMLTTQLILLPLFILMAMQDPAMDTEMIALLAVLVAFTSASQDIVIDAFRVESLREDEQAAGAAMYVYGYRVALLVAGAGALAIADFWGWQMAYLSIGSLILIGAVTVLLRPEPDYVETDEVRARTEKITKFMAGRPNLSGPLGKLVGFVATGVVSPFAEFMSRKGCLVILLFVLLFKFADALAGVMTNPFLIDIGFSLTEIAAVSKGFGFVALLVGLAAGGLLIGWLGVVPSLWLAGILQIISNLVFVVQAQLGADVGFLAVTIGFENFAGGMGTTVFLAYMASLTHSAYTATQFALLSSLAAVGRTIMSSFGGFIVESVGWMDFFVISAAVGLPGLALLWVVSRVHKTDKIVQQ